MTGFFKYRNRKIHFTDQGRGEIIVLLHGYLETSEIWNNYSGKLAEKYRVITPDLPGHGQSDIFSEIHTMDQMAEIINELLKSLEIGKAFLTGHSLGGYIALAFTEHFPGKLSGYCLFHSHPFADSPEVLKKREREINLIRAGKKDLLYPENVVKMFATVNLDNFSESVNRSKEIASSLSGEGIIAVLKGMIARPSRLKVMEKGKVPCLWILGAMDNYINPEEVKIKVRLPENAKLVILKDSGHMGFIEEEEKSLIVIDKFIRERI